VFVEGGHPSRPCIEGGRWLFIDGGGHASLEGGGCSSTEEGGHVLRKGGDHLSRKGGEHLSKERRPRGIFVEGGGGLSRKAVEGKSCALRKEVRGCSLKKG